MSTLPFQLPGIVGSEPPADIFGPGATVFVLAGVFGDPALVPAMLRGEVTRNNTVVEIDYPNNLLPTPDSNLVDGAAILDAALTSTPGKKVVFAHSNGAIVSTRWLHDYGPTSTVSPADLKFVLIGNSVRRYNGYYSVTNYALYGWPNFISSDNNIPVDTPYQVRDIAIRYDGWCDYPDDESNLIAVSNAEYGKSQYHLSYGSIPLHRSDYLEYREGNVTYVLVPTSNVWNRDQIEPAYFSRALFTPSGDPPAGGFVPRPDIKPALKQITEGNDAVTKWRLLDARRQLVLDANRQRPLLRLLDKQMKYLGTVAEERSGSWERLMDDSGVGTISLRWSDWLANLCANDTRVQEDLHLAIDPNPNKRGWRTRLGYRVTAVRAVKHDDGTRTVEIDLISLREHAKHILLGATPWSAPEFQPLKAWVWFQNLRSNLGLATFLNLARSYWPPLAIATSLFDPIHWLTTRVGNFSPLHWPVQVQFVNPVLDQSRMMPLAAKWQDLHSIAEPLMEDAGVALVDYLWMPEDADSPHPELAALVGEQFARPSRACVILAFEDHDGVTGLTGTAADGAANLIGAILDDTITEILLPVDADGDGEVDPFFRRLFGVAPEKPSLVWRDCEYSGLISSEHKLQRATSQTVWTGGHSPTWLNQVITFAVKFGLSQLQTAITEGLFHNEGPAPIGSGLEEVYQEQLSDMLFAYEKFSNPATATWLNDYALLEGFEQGNGYAYVISAALTIRQGLSKRKPRVSFTMKARDGEPWCWGYDYNIAHRGLFEIHGIYHVEQIRGVKWEYDENTPIGLDLTIGKNREQDPFDAGMKALADGWNAIGSIIGGAAVQM